MRKSAAALAVTATLLGLGGSASATTIDLPAPDPFNSAERGAFTVFSLPILVLQQGFILVDGSQETKVKSSPGQIQNDLVLYTGPGGGNLTNNNDPILCGSKVNNCVDDPFPSPSGNKDPSFGTDTSIDPAPKFTGDRSNPVDPKTGLSGNTWDITLAALDQFLTGSNVPIFLFQHNQDNASKVQSDQDVLGWGQVIISDIQGVLPDICFNFNNNTTQAATGCTQPQPFSSRAPDPENPVAGGPQGDFVFAGGQVCLNALGQNVACDGSQGPVVLGPINHNLGADEFAYAILSFNLNDFLASCFANLAACGYEMLRVDFRLRELTNGFEQLIIAQGTVPRVPEPASLVLLGAGIASVSVLVLRRRARRSAQGA